MKISLVAVVVFCFILVFQNCGPVGTSISELSENSSSVAPVGSDQQLIEGDSPEEEDSQAEPTGDQVNNPDDPDLPEDGAGTLLFIGFEKGALGSDLFSQELGLQYGIFPAANSSLVDSPNDSFEGKSLKVKYPGGTLGRNQRVGFSSNFEKLQVGLKDSAYLRYYVKFHPGWEFVKGGKLPGLAGRRQVSGGDNADGTNGWSTRFMWRANGLPVVYAYVPGKYNRAFGFDFKFFDENNNERRFAVDQWHCIEQFVKLNDVGQANGQIQAWLDGQISVNVSDVTFRTVNNNSTKIGQMMFSSFFGGNTDDWAPSKDVFASYDNFVVSDQRIGCLNR